MQVKNTLLRGFSLLLIFLLCTATVFAESNYQQALITKAHELNLSADPQWLALIHHPSLKLDPSTELDKTITDFFRTENLDDNHAQCLMPARFIWLNSVLHFNASQIPHPKCAAFREWYSLIDPYGITLIFPSSFLNNPASAFGHTFIRIDRPPNKESGPLLNYAANYAAATHGEPGLIYALKGLFGGYDGFFSVLPFYQQVTKYSDMESRDIWEYTLSYTPEETALLTAHLWELRQTPFTYYYLDDNCSYELLTLLDVGRPSLKLHQSFSSSVMVAPIDTVKEILTRPNFVNGIHFRASSSSTLKERARNTNSDLIPLVPEIAEGKLPLDAPEIQKLSSSDSAKLFDLAYDYLNFRSLRKKQIDPNEASRALQLLKARSANILVSDPVIVPTPEIRPDEGHSSMKISYGAGVVDHKLAHVLRFRPAYHSLIDPPDGYVQGTQITFLDTELLHRSEDRISLRDVTVLNIKSLTPRDTLLKPLSWHLNSEYYQEIFRNKSDAQLFTLQGGAGRSWNITPRALVYSMLDVSSRFSNDIENGYGVGVGPHVGALFNWNSSITSTLDARYYYYGIGDATNAVSTKAKQRFVTTKDHQVGFDISYKDDSHTSSLSALAMYEVFF